MPPTPAAAPPTSPSRRTFLGQSLALGAAALPTIVSARALGLEAGTAAASERITLGVIGIGQRCRYVLGSMMTLPGSGILQRDRTRDDRHLLAARR